MWKNNKGNSKTITDFCIMYDFMENFVSALNLYFLRKGCLIDCFGDWEVRVIKIISGTYTLYLPQKFIVSLN